MQNISSEALQRRPHPGQVAVAAIEALRPYQWLKNILVFVPLAATHRLGNPALLGLGIRTFLAFSLGASTIYLLNDLHDVAADRAHPHKCLRPIPSGRLPESVAIVLAPLLLVLALWIAVAIGPEVLAVLLVYQLLMVAYTWRLKAVVLLDAFVLATGYAMRVFAGAVALEIVPSARLLAFCIFLFFSLALLKRYAELRLMRSRDGANGHARAYLVADENFVLALGLSCGALSVLVLALYLGGPSGIEHPSWRSLWTWGTCVLLLYWVSHMWLTANRGQMTDDPLVFAVKSHLSIVLLSLIAVSAWLAV